MFTKTASYYDALYHFKDYETACDLLAQLIHKETPHASTLLDVGCGTGKHLFYLKNQFKVSGLDIDGNLLKIARERCPDVPLYEDNMSNFDLGLKYDAVVCLFSSIGYAGTVENLNSSICCMSKHLNKGGILVVEPWIFPENYWIDKLTANFVNKPDLKISWMYISKRENSTSVFDIQYMVGTPTGIETFSERHIMGLWTDEEYRIAFQNNGVVPVYDSRGFFGRGVYYGIKY